jgi:hypothetical protein
MKLLYVLILLAPIYCNAQNIPSEVNTILVKNVKFIDVCNALLDSGYTIEKKDNDLQTVETSIKQYPKLWNATYVVHVRVKDSTAYFSVTYTAPPNGGLFKNETASNLTNKKGVTLKKSLDGYIFLLLNDFALSFKRETRYLKK